MARFRDLNQDSNSWLHDLAKAEVHPEAEKLLHLGRSFDPQQLVEESSVEFMMELKEQFAEYARIFNGYSESGVRYQEVKLFSLAQTAADFMMFRNSIKLVVSNTAHGVIQLAFAQHIRGTLAVNGQVQGATGPVAAASRAQELMAQVGPFRDVFWTYQGEKITPAQVAKFYFAEFARATRVSQRSRHGNQMLLDQIKTLLQEKGFDL